MNLLIPGFAVVLGGEVPLMGSRFVSACLDIHTVTPCAGAPIPYGTFSGYQPFAVREGQGGLHPQ